MRVILISIDEKGVSKLATVADKIMNITPAKTDNNTYATASDDLSKKIKSIKRANLAVNRTS